MHPLRELALMQTRRQFFGRAGLGAAALASLFNDDARAADPALKTNGVLPALHHAPKAKSVIYLVMSGGPSHIDLFDYKPQLKEHYNKDLPASVRMGQRITGMTSGQKTLPVAPSIFKFKQHGKAGAWVSELLPNIATI